MKTKLNRVVLGHIGISTPSGNAVHKFLQNHDEGEIKCRFANWREVTKIYINTKYRQSFQYLHIDLNLTKRHGSNRFKLKFFFLQLLIRTRHNLIFISRVNIFILVSAPFGTSFDTS